MYAKNALRWRRTSKIRHRRRRHRIHDRQPSAVVCIFLVRIFMKAPIPLPVKSINVRHIAPGDWTADITFGIPNDGAHDDPTITLNSGEGVELPPNVGDIMLVRPPEIVGYAND